MNSEENKSSINSIPVELAEALKVVHRYSVLIAKAKMVAPEKILQTLLELDASIPLHVVQGKGNYPYYNERCALRVKKTLDEMISNKKQNWLVDAKNSGVSIPTLYAMYYQGWMYLYERLDTPDKQYARLRNKLKICRERNGIAIRSSAYAINETYIGESTDPIVTIPEFANELEEFLQLPEDEIKFERDMLNMNTHQREYVKNLCENVPKVFMHTLTQYKILIIKSAVAAKYNNNNNSQAEETK